MEKELTAVCTECRNFFIKTIEQGWYTLTDGEIPVKDTYIAGQYVYLVGSMVNDGVHKVDEASNGTIRISGTTNEEFRGAICGLAIPQDFLEVVKEIEAQMAIEASDTSDKTLQSESFSNYSYNRASGGGASGGVAATWKEAFATKLNPYRKMYRERVV
ncbi:hypothetical protein LJC49_07155 [Ruminococcaceae bacterium OttesenSCG-928-I18]|nr:hypothetical protein [Ruminococcaceae bacterium OttesenSCG-928-I18]